MFGGASGEVVLIAAKTRRGRQHALMDRPLITYMVASFNQEAFIREAVESAFAQTYSPLEIILSDDASRDRTFEIASAMASAYRGPHQIRLNRNPATLGISGHANRVMELSRGELVVAAAGDDVSLPTRTEVIYQAWEQSGRRATSLFSSYETIQADGSSEGIGGVRGNAADARKFQPLEGTLFDFLCRQLPVVNGCTHAWSRELFDFFGPLRSDLEDLALSFRTLAIGQLLYIHEPLVQYRRHGSNVSFFPGQDDARAWEFERREQRLRWVDEKSAMAYEGMLADIATLRRRGRLSEAESRRLTAQAERMRNFYATERQMLEDSALHRVRTLAATAGRGDLKLALRFLPRALPRPLFRRLYLLRERWRSASRGN